MTMIVMTVIVMTVIVMTVIVITEFDCSVVLCHNQWSPGLPFGLKNDKLVQFGRFSNRFARNKFFCP